MNVSLISIKSISKLFYDIIVIVGIAAVNDDAALVVYSPSLELKQTVPLNRGDVLVMRGDTVHSGAAYANGHFGRIHCYLDHPLCKRGYNSTERVDVTTVRTNQSSSVVNDTIVTAKDNFEPLAPPKRKRTRKAKCYSFR